MNKKAAKSPEGPPEMFDGGIIGKVNNLFKQAIKNKRVVVVLEYTERGEFQFIGINRYGDSNVLETLDSSWIQAIVTRVKVLANLALAESQIFQSGLIHGEPFGAFVNIQVLLVPRGETVYPQTLVLVFSPLD